MSTLAFRFGRRIGWLLQFYPARLVVNLAYKVLYLGIAAFISAPFVFALHWIGLSVYFSGTAGGAIGLLIFISAFPERDEAMQVLLGWPRRRR